MLKTPYDAAQHLHLGYYEHGWDIEAIALKVADQELWHVWFVFGQYGLEVPVALQNAPYDPDSVR